MADNSERAALMPALQHLRDELAAMADAVEPASEEALEPSEYAEKVVSGHPVHRAVVKVEDVMARLGKPHKLPLSIRPAWYGLLNESRRGDDMDDLAAAVRTMLDAVEKELATKSAPPDTGVDDVKQTAALTKAQRQVLCAMATFDTAMLVSAKEVEDAMALEERLSERTITPAIRCLVERGLAERPEGERQGAHLTIQGRRLAQKIAD